MTKTPHVPIDDLSTTAGPASGRTDGGAESAGPGRLAALVAVEPATRNLLSVWLGEHHWVVVDLDGDTYETARPPQVIIIEVAFPRAVPPPELPSLARRFPGVPIVVVSPTIVAGTPIRGDVARQLGVAAVLAMPLSRAVLLGTIHDLTGLSR